MTLKEFREETKDTEKELLNYRRQAQLGIIQEELDLFQQWKDESMNQFDHFAYAEVIIWLKHKCTALLKQE